MTGIKSLSLLLLVHSDLLLQSFTVYILTDTNIMCKLGTCVLHKCLLTVVDLTLEFEDSELYQHFETFFYDILPEFKAVGRVIQLKVCCNYEPHLRGNVYVQYSRLPVFY